LTQTVVNDAGLGEPLVQPVVKKRSPKIVHLVDAVSLHFGNYPR
jgi:hypothetical protein